MTHVQVPAASQPCFQETGSETPKTLVPRFIREEVQILMEAPLHLYAQYHDT